MRRTIPAAKILTWWRRWKTSSKSKDTATVSPKVEIMLGFKQRVYYDGRTRQFPCIKHFRLYYPKDIRNKTNEPEIVTNVNKNAQQNEIHNVNTVCCIDAYNALIASIYLHQCFYILKILAHSVDFNELYRNVTIHCPSFSLVR